jgi:hypothetical protein
VAKLLASSSEREVRARGCLKVEALAQVKQCTDFLFPPYRIPNSESSPHRPAIAVRAPNGAARVTVLNSVA